MAKENFIISILKKCNPDPTKAGNLLLNLNALGILFAAGSNTFAAAIDKNTSKEDKKFLVPAGAATGVANLGIYYLMTNRIISHLKNSAQKEINKMDTLTLEKNAKTYAQNALKKAQKGLFKKSEEYIKSMEKTLFENGSEGKITAKAIELYKDNVKAAGGVLGAFIGAVIGCSILTPIIRDVSAYFVQKHMKKSNPNITNDDLKHFYTITSLNNSLNSQNKMPLTMKNYMNYSSSQGLKI